MNTLNFVLSFFSTQIWAGDVVPAPQLIFVGNGSGACALTSIQAAIDQATPNSEIRVTNEITYFESLNVDKNLTIKGGYSSYGLAQLDDRLDENRATINAGGLGNAVEVINDHTILHMSGFILTNGSNEGNLVGSALGGAMSILGSNAEIELSHMQLTNNHGYVGGGIYQAGSDATVVLSNTLIDSNTAESGGGIYCANGGELQLNDDSGLVGNSATGDVDFVGYGGGLFALVCDVFLRSGEGTDTAFHLVGISNNIATKDGGGIYALSSHLMTSSYAGLVNIDHNMADHGGGIYLSDTWMDLHQMFFDGNVANGNGGALYLDGSRYLATTLFGPMYNACLMNVAGNVCNAFINNRADGEFGGAIFMENGSGPLSSDSSLRARFINNLADNGSAITVQSGSRMQIQNSYFINNGANGNSGTGDNSTIRVNDNDSTAQVYFSTFANNHTDRVFSVADDGHVSLINAIVYDDVAGNGVVQTAAGGTFGFGCTLFHEGATVGPINPFNLSEVTEDPGFIDPLGGNYHLRLDSVAIDRCALAGIDPDIIIQTDLDGDVRPMNEMVPGTGYDAGADESIDLIFKHGFE